MPLIELFLPEPRFAPGDFVVLFGTRPGACHKVLDCLGVTETDIRRRWYTIEVGGVRVSACEDDLEPAEAIAELGRIVR